MNDKKYFKLTPFKMQVLQSFPFIDADFDALTNYELLCKIVEYLNVTIENVNIMEDDLDQLKLEFTALKNYIDNYFDNLDVQDEINNKLDEMAESGELEEIIAQFVNLNSINIFNSVSDMKSAENLTNGSVAQTLGFYNANDGGGAIYRIRTILSTDNINEMNIIALHDVNLIAELLSSGVTNVKQFGAKGDATHDDTDNIQCAIDNTAIRGCIYFPKSTNCRYKISSALDLTINECTFYSEPTAEYDTKLFSTENITLVNVKAYGVRISGIVFEGNGTSNTEATTNGLNIDRSSLGDDETNANLDAEIKDCKFFYLKTAITFKGRNVYVHDNGFCICDNGVVGNLYTYNSGSDYSDLRGIRITNNRFHAMFNHYDSGETTYTPSTLPVWCIKMPEESSYVHHIEITNNNCDFCKNGFYKGFLTGAKITDNSLYECTTLLVVADGSDSDLYTETGEYWGDISNNIVSCVPSLNVKFTSLCLSFIILNNYRNVSITNNNFRRCYGDAISITAGWRIEVANNKIQYYGVTTPASSSAIAISGTSQVFANDNLITGAPANARGITGDSNTALFAHGNVCQGITTPLNVPAPSIKTSVTKTAWSLPTLQHNFSYINGNTAGIRKHENGLVEVQMVLTGGTDNSVAFTLPEGYRPEKEIRIANIALWQGRQFKDSAQVIVQGTGSVIINFDDNLSDPSSTYFCLYFSFYANN